MKNDTLKNLLKVFSSNLFNLFSSVIITFLLPHIFTPTDYGYWSLYLLYVSYAGFIIFGYCDGIYLKTIGEKYEDLNFPKLKFFLIVLFLYLLIAVSIFLPITFFLNINVTKWYIILLSIIGIFLSCLNSFFILINQATQKYTNYAVGNIIEKLILVISVCIALLFKIKNILFIALASVIGKVITLVYYTVKNNRIVFSKAKKYPKFEVFDNIKIGFFLTISSVFSMLMTGISKFFVESKYGIEYLGYYSFVFSLFSPFTQLTDSVALILLPKIKQNMMNAKNIIIKVNRIINYLTPFVLLFYLFGKYCILIIFNKYINSIGCFMYLCPLIVIQARISIIYNSYFKVIRKERSLLLVNTISLLVNILLLYLGNKIFNSFVSVALVTFVSFYIRDILYKLFMYKKFEIKLNFIDYSLVCFIIYFIMIFIGVNDYIILFTLGMLCIISIYMNINIIRRFFGGKKNEKENTSSSRYI